MSVIEPKLAILNQKSAIQFKISSNHRCLMHQDCTLNQKDSIQFITISQSSINSTYIDVYDGTKISNLKSKECQTIHNLAQSKMSNLTRLHIESKEFHTIHHNLAI